MILGWIRGTCALQIQLQFGGLNTSAAFDLLLGMLVEYVPGCPKPHTEYSKMMQDKPFESKKVVKTLHSHQLVEICYLAAERRSAMHHLQDICMYS